MMDMGICLSIWVSNYWKAWILEFSGTRAHAHGHKYTHTCVCINIHTYMLSRLKWKIISPILPHCLDNTLYILVYSCIIQKTSIAWKYVCHGAMQIFVQITLIPVSYSYKILLDLCSGREKIVGIIFPMMMSEEKMNGRLLMLSTLIIWIGLQIRPNYGFKLSKYCGISFSFQQGQNIRGMSGEHSEVEILKSDLHLCAQTARAKKHARDHTFPKIQEQQNCSAVICPI